MPVGALPSPVTVKDWWSESTPALFVVKTSLGSVGSAAALVNVYAPAVCDQPAARVGNVVEATPDSLSV
jgi:hypothetical protein